MTEHMHEELRDSGGDGGAGESVPAGRAGESEPAGRAGESEPAGRAGESEPAGRAGESEPAGRAGESEPAGRAGESEPAGRAGESEPAGRAGESEPAGRAGESEPAGRAGESDIDVVLVTGLSGAGRGTAAKVLEDLGWYVADNLPPELIAQMVELGLAAGSRITQLAVVMDVRSRGFTGDLDWVRNDLATRNINPRVLFLEASDDILVRRYEQNRRSHPLQGNQTLAEGITAERSILAPLRAVADLVIDTSKLSVPALRESIERAFGGETIAHTSVTVESFGYKYGLPMDADTVMDVRFLPNPHWVDELRPHTGQHPAVRDYVLGRPGAAEFLDTYHQLLDVVIEGYRREGKRYMTVAIGCTGGKHRSVAMAEALAARLEGGDALTVRVLHRDLGRE
jgi:RNase adapter protein RapZ